MYKENQHNFNMRLRRSRLHCQSLTKNIGLHCLLLQAVNVCFLLLTLTLLITANSVNDQSKGFVSAAFNSYYNYSEIINHHLFPGIHEFSTHTVIKPQMHHALNKRQIYSTLDANGLHIPHIVLSYNHRGHRIIIDLKRNDPLLPDTHFLRYQNSNNSNSESFNAVIVTNFTKAELELCHYQGSVRNRPQSYVAISTCSSGGINGVVYDGVETYFIHSTRSGQLYDDHLLLNDKHFLNNNFLCGNSKYVDKDILNYKTNNLKLSQLNSRLSFNNVHLRHKRLAVTPDSSQVIRGPFNSNKHSSYVELVMVVDSKAYKSFGENMKKVHQHCKDLANIINALYVPLNIFIALVGVVVWNESDEIEITQDADVTLKHFLIYRRTKLVLEHPNDNAQLLTKVKFVNGVVGKALKGPICTHEFSGGVSMEHSQIVAVVATTMAHELGHNFGMEHDSPDCKCQDEKCIMSASSTSVVPVHWSSCSVDQLNIAFSRGMNYCLLNKPMKLFDSPQCGNGFVEPGEQCDCGLPAYCKNTCCDPYTCMLHSNASCATGECCDLMTCRPKIASTLCRNAENECDLPEYCTGESEYCPMDVYKRDTVECDNGGAFCYQGSCRSHSHQCRILWGPTGENSEPCYSEMNTQGKRGGNCGVNRLNNTFIPCAVEHVACGMLHCRHLNERLEFGMESAAVISHSFITRDNNVVPCRTALVDLGLQSRDPGLAPNGAKCGDQKMCINQKCESVEYLRTTGMGKPCPENCNGNGVCNSRGNCHCNIGFTGLTCMMPGHGGSVDSGPATNPNSHEAFQRFIYIFIFAVIPIMAAFCFSMYYCRNHSIFMGGKLAENMYVSTQNSVLSFSTSSNCSHNITSIIDNLHNNNNSATSSYSSTSCSTSSLSRSINKANDKLLDINSVDTEDINNTQLLNNTKNKINITNTLPSTSNIINNSNCTSNATIVTVSTTTATIASNCSILNTNVITRTIPIARSIIHSTSNNNLHFSNYNSTNLNEIVSKSNYDIRRVPNSSATIKKSFSSRIHEKWKLPSNHINYKFHENNKNDNTYTVIPIKQQKIQQEKYKTNSLNNNSKNSDTGNDSRLNRKLEISNVCLKSTTNPNALIQDGTYKVTNDTNRMKSASGATKQTSSGTNNITNNVLPKSTSSTDDMNSALLKSPSDCSDVNSMSNGMFGKFKGFTLRPLNNDIVSPNNFNGSNVAYVQPTLQDTGLIIPQRVAPPPPNKQSDLLARKILFTSSTNGTNKKGPPLPPPNINLNLSGRPTISMPVLENSTNVEFSKKNVLISEGATSQTSMHNTDDNLKQAPPPPVPLHTDPKLNVQRDGTIRRIASLLKKDNNKLPVKEKCYINRETLRTLEISAPITATTNSSYTGTPLGESSNSDSESTLVLKEEETKNLVKRAQSMKSPSNKKNPIQSFGSMRQTNATAIRPKSVVSSHASLSSMSSRPKSPPPRPPPVLIKTNSTTSSGYQMPISTKQLQSDHTYDDCEVEVQHTALNKINSHDKDSDNIYAVIEDTNPEVIIRPLKNDKSSCSGRNSVSSTTDISLLNEIVKEIEKRNGGSSVYTSSNTVKTKVEESKPKEEMPAAITDKQQLAAVSATNAVPSSSYLRPPSTNTPIARVAPTRADLKSAATLSSFKPTIVPTNRVTQTETQIESSATFSHNRLKAKGIDRTNSKNGNNIVQAFNQKSSSKVLFNKQIANVTAPISSVSNSKPSATIQKPKILSTKPTIGNNSISNMNSSINTRRPLSTTKMLPATSHSQARTKTTSHNNNNYRNNVTSTVASIAQRFENTTANTNTSTNGVTASITGSNHVTSNNYNLKSKAKTGTNNFP